MYLQEGFFMSFNKTTMLFLFSVLIQNNIFTMITIANPALAHTIIYIVKEGACYFVAEKNRFTGLADVVNNIDNDEYAELKQYESDLKILKNNETKTGDKRQAYQIVTEKYCDNRDKFSNKFQTNLKKMAEYNPLNWKNVILFGPVTPLVEYVALQLFEITPIKILGSHIFAQYSKENKQIVEHVVGGTVIVFSGLIVHIAYVLALIYGSSYLLVKSLPWFIEQTGIEIKIPQKYQPLASSGVVGFVLDKMKKS